MSHSYTSALFHCVFSTKERRKTITEDLQDRLWQYMGGIARENKMRALTIGGVEDHVHLLLSIPSTLSVAKAMQLIKGASSKWVHETFPEHREFEWQEGYGAFSIGVAQVPDTKRYIENQREHHRTRTFQEEFIAFLERHGIEYDPRYVWG
jgi:REP element-mobilizing transposase RayT